MGQFPVRGVIPALFTPFDQTGEPDLDALTADVMYLQAAGVDALCVGAATGETVGSTPEELGRICAAVTAAAAKPVLAIIYPDSTREAFALADAAQRAGVSALLVAQPHYLFQPGAQGLTGLFTALRPSVGVPIAISNSVPSAPLDLTTIQTLVDLGLVDAVHHGGEDAHLLADLLCVQPRVPVLAGIESLMLVALLLGADGIVGSMAAVFPHDCVALRDAVASRDLTTARTIHERLLRAWRAVNDPAEMLARLKFACHAQGRSLGMPRSPYDWLSPSGQADVRRAIAGE